MFWQTSRRKFSFKKTLVMGILNVTPDSFSDGGNFFSIDDALKQAEQLIEEGADILDIGGESTRPKSARVSAEEEIRRVIPIIEAIAKRLNIPISIDTSKAAVTEKAIEAGAEVINDISGLRFDERIGEVAARTNAGLVLMHSRGEFELMHKQMPVENILREVSEGLKWSIEKAKVYGVKKENIALDVGIGFSKTFEQNLELIAKLNTICQEFSGFPILIGTSRKSFIGKILGDVSTDERLQGSLASAAIAVWNGANIVRVHDVKATFETLKIVDIIKERAGISNPVS
jgi:dihydropteroate synthase